MYKLIRILHYGLSENRGGIETYLNKLWMNIDKSHFVFDFLDTNEGNPCFYEEFTSMGSKFYKITSRKKSIRKNREELENLFSSEKFDILHCHLNTLSYIEPIKIAIKHGCKVIVHSRSSNAPDSIKTKILHYVNYLYLKKNKDVVKLAVSNLAGEWLFGKEASYQIVNNGIDVNIFKFDRNIRNIKRKELGIEDKFVIGHVGALNYPKNHEYLFMIFKNYLNINNNSILLLVGDGALKEYLKDLAHKFNIEDKVVFLGIRRDIPELMFAMDHFVFTSHYEGFPNVVLEAQTTGLPCLISDNITPEVIISNNCKALSIKIDPARWATQIFESDVCLNRHFEYEVIQNHGYSVREEIKKIEKIYFEI